MRDKILTWFKNLKSTTGRTTETYPRILSHKIDIFDLRFEELFLDNLVTLKNNLFEGYSIQYYFRNDNVYSRFWLFKNPLLSKFSIKYESGNATCPQELSQNYVDEISPSEVVEFLKKSAHQKTVSQLKNAFNEKKQAFKEQILTNKIDLLIGKK